MFDGAPENPLGLHVLKPSHISRDANGYKVTDVDPTISAMFDGTLAETPLGVNVSKPSHISRIANGKMTNVKPQKA